MEHYSLPSPANLNNQFQKETRAFNSLQITSIVYKILDYLPDQDPLKYKAKEKALSILEKTNALFSSRWISLKNYFSPEREKEMVQLLEDIEALENYLVVARHQGWINHINFLIIQKEYDAIKKATSPSKKLQQGISKAAHKSQFIQNNMQAGNQEMVKNVYFSASDTLSSNANSKKVTISTKALARQGKIIGILNQREKAQVADFIKELPNTTKRTIRRDLNYLLEKKSIERIGKFNMVFYKLLENRQTKEKMVHFDRTEAMSQ